MNYEVGSKKMPNEGVRPTLSAGEKPRMDANVVSDGSEEGEIKDDAPECSLFTTAGTSRVYSKTFKLMNTEAGSKETRSEGVRQNDQPVSTKRKRSPSNEEQRPSKRTQDPQRGIKSYKEKEYPSQQKPCVININEEKAFGLTLSGK